MFGWSARFQKCLFVSLLLMPKQNKSISIFLKVQGSAKKFKQYNRVNGNCSISSLLIQEVLDGMLISLLGELILLF